MGMVRKTQQREILQRTIEGAGRPLSVPEIHTLAMREWPRLGIATVYREIKRLHEENAIIRVDIPGENAPRYEPVHGDHAHHHHHFKCETCGKVFDIHACALPVEQILPTGFRHHSHEITIYGNCRNCH